MNFLVPGNLPTEAADGLRRAYLAGGYDHSPVQTRIDLAGDRLSVRRDHDESGYLSAPWEIEGAGRLMGSTATLMERPEPYRFLVELARGKINHIRSQAAEWKHGGLAVSSGGKASARPRGVRPTRSETSAADSDRHALAARLSADRRNVDGTLRRQLLRFAAARQERIGSLMSS